MQIIELPRWPLLAANVAIWIVIQMGAGIAAQHMPSAWFAHDRFLFRTRRWEQGGEFWQTLFRVRSWKHLLPDGAKVFRNGFAKRHLRACDSAFLQTFILESRRAELTHWIVLPFTALFFLFNPPIGSLISIAYALAANAPCIIAQRFNRPRIQRVLDRRACSASSTAAANDGILGT